METAGNGWKRLATYTSTIQKRFDTDGEWFARSVVSHEAVYICHKGLVSIYLSRELIHRLWRVWIEVGRNPINFEWKHNQQVDMTYPRNPVWRSKKEYSLHTAKRLNLRVL